MSFQSEANRTIEGINRNVQFNRVSLGLCGGLYISDTSAHPGNYFAVQMITDTVIATATNGSITGITGVSIPAGTIIYLSATSLTLTSGTCIAYYAQ